MTFLDNLSQTLTLSSAYNDNDVSAPAAVLWTDKEHQWEALCEQPLGWNPDLNDGVRLNLRPLVEAGFLRAKFTINWNKDRGKNPDGSDRENDVHLTVAEKWSAVRGG